MSASVMAKASINGWYIAAFLCRSTIGRCPYKVGISESGTNVVNRTAKKRIPPREKKADVLSGNLTNTVPMITDMIKKELGTLSRATCTGQEDQLTRAAPLVPLYFLLRFGSVEL